MKTLNLNDLYGSGVVKKIKPNEEIECDRAKITEDSVLVRINGVWIELRPSSRQWK